MNNEELLAATAVNAWRVTIDQLDRLVSTLTDEQLQAQVSPNRIAYITSSDTSQQFTDRMLPLLSFGTRLHPELDEQFLEA